jgi:PAS domain S-box-containing protein
LAISDISDIRLMEDALHKSEARYRAIMDQAADTIIMNDHRGRIIDVNQKACQSLGYSREELLSRSIRDIDPDAIQAGTALKLWDGVIAGGSFTFESRHRRKDGSSFPVEETLGPVRLPTGPAILAIVRDITERKRVETALMIATQKLNLLSSITRHDINNQTIILEGHLAILVMAQPQLSSNEHIKKAEVAARHISAMIHFTKEYEDIGVNNSQWQGIRALIEKEAEKISLGKVRVVNDVPADVEIFADPLIQKVFYNLIENAVRHGDKVTTIRFSELESGDGHQIICEDDGVGIIAEMKERVFEHGFEKEHGLGLFLSREILAITGITLLEKGEPGKGAQFEITVPTSDYRIRGKISVLC